MSLDEETYAVALLGSLVVAAVALVQLNSLLPLALPLAVAGIIHQKGIR
jgi:hypothetical protein